MRTQYHKKTASAAEKVKLLENYLAYCLSILKTHQSWAVKLQTLLTCSITSAITLDPVVTQDGHSYDRAAITQWLSEHRTSPNTGLALQRPTLTPCIKLQQCARHVHENKDTVFRSLLDFDLNESPDLQRAEKRESELTEALTRAEDAERRVRTAEQRASKARDKELKALAKVILANEMTEGERKARVRAVTGREKSVQQYLRLWAQLREDARDKTKQLKQAHEDNQSVVRESEARLRNLKKEHIEQIRKVTDRAERAEHSLWEVSASTERSSSRANEAVARAEIAERDLSEVEDCVERYLLLIELARRCAENKAEEAINALTKAQLVSASHAEATHEHVESTEAQFSATIPPDADTRLKKLLSEVTTYIDNLRRRGYTQKANIVASHLPKLNDEVTRQQILNLVEALHIKRGLWPDRPPAPPKKGKELARELLAIHDRINQAASTPVATVQQDKGSNLTQHCSPGSSRQVLSDLSGEAARHVHQPPSPDEAHLSEFTTLVDNPRMLPYAGSRRVQATGQGNSITHLSAGPSSSADVLDNSAAHVCGATNPSLSTASPAL